MVEEAEGRRDLDPAVDLIRALQDTRTEDPRDARIGERLGALATDCGIAVATLFVLAVASVPVVLVWRAATRDGRWVFPDAAQAALTVAAIGIWLGFTALNGVSGLHGRGMSTGKESTDLRLVHSDGMPPSMPRRLGRWATAAMVTAALGVVAMFGQPPYSAWSYPFHIALLGAWLALLVGSGPRGIHDLIWRTKVIAPRRA